MPAVLKGQWALGGRGGDLRLRTTFASAIHSKTCTITALAQTGWNSCLASWQVWSHISSWVRKQYNPQSTQAFVSHTIMILPKADQNTENTKILSRCTDCWHQISSSQIKNERWSFSKNRHTMCVQSFWFFLSQIDHVFRGCTWIAFI